jgi:hypothetical protein
MSLLPFCQWLASTRGSIALHESFYLYPLVESAHVLTLCLFVGMSVVWDLRLLGMMLPRVSMTEMSERIRPLMFVGFIAMVITGVLLFYAIPVRFYQNIFFRLKIVMIVVAGLNAWVFHAAVFQTVGDWGAGTVAPRSARVAGAASLILWAGIVIAGRMIAYNWFDCDIPQRPFVVWAAGCTEKA